MKKIKTGFIRIKDIKHIENSRLRENEDVSDLMRDIEQRGLLQSVGIRTSDNALIYGNRRVRAFELLGYDSIPCDFYNEMNDEDLLMTNLIENIKRRKIGSIEIGRIVNILMKKEMTQSEIAEKLGISTMRVQSCSSAYNIAYDTKFMDLIRQKTGGTNQTGITESMIWKVQVMFQHIRYKLSKSDWNLIMSYLEKEKLNTKNIGVLRTILLNMERPNLAEALDRLEETKTVYGYIAVKRVEWDKLKSREKIDNDLELVRMIVNKYDNKVLF